MNWLDKAYCKCDLSQDPSLRSATRSGSRFKRERVLKDHNGIMELETVENSDLYDYIQSHADSVDIYTILRRYESGDVTALDRAKAQYLDITNAPKTLAEMYSFIQNCSKYFEGLPLEVRKEYDFNPAAFVADIGSEKFMKMMSDKETDKVKDVVSEVTEGVAENA